MDDQYKDAIIESAKEKLKSAGKALSEPELLRGIVHLLKKNYGKDDLRHSSKGRFRSKSFNVIIETSDWKKAIKQLPDRKFIRAEKYELEVDKLAIEEEWIWVNVTREIALQQTISIFKKIDPYKFEGFVKDVLQKYYPDYTFAVTKRSGDLGRDIIGTMADPHHPDSRFALFVQVKRYSKTVSITEARELVGAINNLRNDKHKNYSRFEGLFVTSGKYPKSVIAYFNSARETGVTYSCWDGKGLAERMINLGMGVKFSLDLNFWKEVDSSMLPINNTEKDSTR